MPSAPKPKPWVAARNFKHGKYLYRKGDPVTRRSTIELLSRRGDKWITRAPKPPVAEPDQPTPTKEAASDGS